MPADIRSGRNSELAQQQLRQTNTLRVFADQMDNIWLYGQGTLFLYNKSTRQVEHHYRRHTLGLTGHGVTMPSTAWRATAAATSG